MLDTIKQLLAAISWPVATLIIFVILRRSIARFLDRATKITAGKTGISIEALKKDLDETKKTLAGTVAAGVPPKEEFTQYKKMMKGSSLEAANTFERNYRHYRAEPYLKSEEKEKKLLTPLTNEEYIPEDPQKNQWGKLSENRYRRLSATVELMPGNSRIYKIKLQIVSTNPLYPLRDTVWFHLHPTFANPDQEVDVVNGKAELFLLAWGSFTVGVETDHRTVQLELDLAQVPGVTEAFKNT